MKGNHDPADLIPLLETESLRKIRRTDKKLYRALGAVAGRVARQAVLDSPADLLLWVYLTGVAHGAEVARRAKP